MNNTIKDVKIKGWGYSSVVKPWVWFSSPHKIIKYKLSYYSEVNANMIIMKAATAICLSPSAFGMLWGNGK